MNSKIEYHLFITDEDRFLDTSQIPCKPQSHKYSVDFAKQTSKQYVTPKFASSELMHRNPEFNRLDIKDVQTRVPTFDISKGESRDKFWEKFRAKIPGLVPKTQAEYSPSFNEPKPPSAKNSPKFDKMMDRSVINSIYYKANRVPEGYDDSKLQKAFSMRSDKKRNVAYLDFKKQKERDMKMYRQTEQLKNIENDNERYRYLQSILKQL